MSTDWNDFDADEEPAERNEHYSTYPSLESSWLYVVADTRDMQIAKIGLTTKKAAKQRLMEGKTFNPFIVLFATYDLSKTTWGVSQKELRDIEQYIHSRAFGEPIPHISSGRDSEWFYMSPEEAENRIDQNLAKRAFSVNNRYLYSNYDGDHSHRGLYIERMRQIKKLHHPDPYSFARWAEKMNYPEELYKGYLEYIHEYFLRDPKNRPYL
ncbi:GIY-YIG nuclease family protein [uncultured Pseudomonas sp.]|uniref:GIY-YIG nuclease family protein n=1 Tax=uncultured Pseudomonas sp. TaxID=114707 RepID=UPI00258382D3|nr:GIY-YIG nuclease family protein [uncultured Pseudomonas sp.]